MSCLNIHLGDGQVTFDHVQGGVAKDPLKGIDIAAIAKEIDREGMAETVNGGIRDAGTLAQAVDRLQEVVAADGCSVDRSKGRGVDQHVGAGCKVRPKRLGGPAGDGDLALLAPFAHHDDVPVAQIHVFEFETAIFAGADAGIEKQK